MRKTRTWLVYLILFGVLAIMVTSVNQLTGNKPDELSYQEFVQLVKDDNVEGARLTATTLTGIYKKSYRDTGLAVTNLPGKYDFSVYVADREAFNNDMAVIAADKTGKSAADVTSLDYSFDFSYVKPPDFSIFDIIPYIILGGGVIFLWYMIMQQQGGGSKINSFGKSRARVVMDGQAAKTFADVAGADEEKEELQEIVEFLKNPQRFTDIGARIPKGVLLMGPPGTGKTLLARAVAGEAGAPFFSISGSDFVEMFVGVGASRVRDLFNTAKKSSPSIVFIDEIDAVGRHRGAGMGGGHDEREQTLNQLLVEMDGFAPHEGIIIIAATNRPDILDPALLRPGRFDRQITVNTPDVKGREDILKVHARNKPLEADVRLDVLAKRTPGFTGADLENVLNEGAILAARRHKRKVGMQEIEEAITRVIAGPQKKSRLITPEDKRITAYHEAGHAIVAKVLPGCDKIHEVSIIQRGSAAGYTMTLPETEHQHLTRSKLLDAIAMLMGGRVAEALVIGDISTGAYNDLQRATDAARKMVQNYGMSAKLGPVFLGNETEIFIGKDFGHQRSYSEEVAGEVDAEIRRILNESYNRAMEVLSQHREVMDRVVDTLIEREHIDGDEFDALFEGRDLPEKHYLNTTEPEPPDESDGQSPAPDEKTLLEDPIVPAGDMPGAADAT